MKTLIIVSALIMIAIVSNMSYNDEVAEQDFYCEMVSAGTWRDYKEIYSVVCTESE